MNVIDRNKQTPRTANITSEQNFEIRRKRAVRLLVRLTAPEDGRGVSWRGCVRLQAVLHHQGRPGYPEAGRRNQVGSNLQSGMAAQRTAQSFGPPIPLEKRSPSERVASVHHTTSNSSSPTPHHPHPPVSRHSTRTLRAPPRHATPRRRAMEHQI